MIGNQRVPHLLRHRALEREALYRVVDTTPEYVDVEVVSAPGLTPGARLRFTQKAVAQMSVVEDTTWERAKEEPRGNESPATNDHGTGSNTAAA
jgi:hypothetical protein